MSQQTERLERLITEQLGECCEGDMDARLDSLETLAREVPDDPTDEVKILKALGNDTRYQIVRLLHAADGELCVCEITPVVEVSDSAISHALSDLHDAGLVSRRKEGTWRYYRLAPGTATLLSAIDLLMGRSE
jgi:DNA-binding transcriptional ArsR family regulator